MIKNARKKKANPFSIVFLAFLGVVIGVCMVAAGCAPIEPETYNWQGKQVTEDQLEEIVESMIEMENPDYDLDVDISEDLD